MTTNPLERVIAEQQAKIDELTKMLASEVRLRDTAFTKHNDLFELWGKFLDTKPPKNMSHNDPDTARYADLRHAVRMAMMDAGFCLRCRNFMCECEE